jgi:hypothetical protein
MENFPAVVVGLGGAGERVFDADEVFGVSIAAFLLVAQTFLTGMVSEQPWPKDAKGKVLEVDHLLACSLSTNAKTTIKLDGWAQIRSHDGLSDLRMFVSSNTKGWMFIKGGVNETIGSRRTDYVTVELPVADGNVLATAKTYALQISIAQRLQGMNGNYGSVRLIDQNDGTPAMDEGKPYSVLATGICQLKQRVG